MSYKLLYTNTAFKDIKKLDIVAKKRIGKKIEEFSKDPFSTSKKLVNSSIGSYRWRIGNYRVIFDIDNKNIVILRVGHRKEIYKF
ncbi:MAG: hypothetical protein A2152_02315 [Candidatus Levybacteria bacterium RBG_16_35_6]|nr:MAG: hypothetical protein A2152_02315 [Candidatus Levybacteria bacterium RBG_16_35_6]